MVVYSCLILFPNEIRRGWVGKKRSPHSGTGGSPDSSPGSNCGRMTHQLVGCSVTPDGHVSRPNETVVTGMNRGKTSDRPYGPG